ncbi:MAG: hypothetical protein WDN25_03945 [Acetobacteraceae bacterium]
MTTYFSEYPAALDIAIPSSALNGLADGAYAITATPIDNRPTLGSAVSYNRADLLIDLASAVTVGATPSIIVWVLPSVDGTNYPTPPGTSAAAAPPYFAYSFPLTPSVSSQRFTLPNLELTPDPLLILIQSKLGVGFPASGNTCRLRRRGLVAW